MKKVRRVKEHAIMHDQALRELWFSKNGKSRGFGGSRASISRVSIIGFSSGLERGCEISKNSDWELMIESSFLTTRPSSSAETLARPVGASETRTGSDSWAHWRETILSHIRRENDTQGNAVKYSPADAGVGREDEGSIAGALTRGGNVDLEMRKSEIGFGSGR